MHGNLTKNCVQMNGKVQKEEEGGEVGGKGEEGENAAMEVLLLAFYPGRQFPPQAR